MCITATLIKQLFLYNIMSEMCRQTMYKYYISIYFTVFNICFQVPNMSIQRATEKNHRIYIAPEIKATYGKHVWDLCSFYAATLYTCLH